MTQWNKAAAAAFIGISENRLRRLLAILEKRPDFEPYGREEADRRVVLLTEWHIEQIRILIERQEGVVRLPPRKGGVSIRPTTTDQQDAAPAPVGRGVLSPIPTGWRTWSAFVVECALVHRRSIDDLKEVYAVYGEYITPDRVRCNWIIDRDAEDRCCAEHPQKFARRGH